MKTLLDEAHASMEAVPDDGAARLRFYERLADAELYLLLEAEAVAESVEPRLFEVGEARVALVFDREERLAEFAGVAAFHACLSGRVLAGLLAGQGIGLGLNLDVAPSSILLPAEAVDWLANMLIEAPEEVEMAADEIRPPGAVPEALLSALDAKLAAIAGRARIAYLAGLRWRAGGQGTVLAFIDAAPGSESALARAVGEALRFSGLEAGQLDVAFFAAPDPVAARLAKVGLRIELPQIATPDGPAAPGMDPAAPPRLR